MINMRKQEILNRINPLFLKGVMHRGYHDETITENSLGAFKKAIDSNYAFELDVHLSKDNHLIVSHDSSLKRTTNKEGIIEELSLKEIKENYRLLNNEEVPTLEEVLALNNEKVPMVIELKPYTKTKNYKVLALALSKVLSKVKDSSNFIIISFYPQCLMHMDKKKFIRALLINKENTWTFLLRHLFEGLDLEYCLLDKEKFAKAKKKKLMLCWTIRNKEEFNNYKKRCDSVTFENIKV